MEKTIFRKLKKEELLHLLVGALFNEEDLLEKVKQIRRFQKNNEIRCFECRSMAKKLGLEE